jgi:predicted CXXCH cytochrome family protein
VPRLALLVLLLAVPVAAADTPPGRADTPGWVGAAACARCHEAETKAWTGSHHDRAMEKPSPATVAAPFAGETFTKDGVTTTFSRRGDAYVVRTDGPDGALHDYEVAWTFGIEPLQQYLIAMPGGRLQSLGIAWDTRPKADGGQRWFHLYPDERIDHRDELHWTAAQQNWNFTCAECHSTNLEKRYDAATDAFRTTWTDVNVACEACHGPGAAHVAWAEQRGAGRTPPDVAAGAPRYGLTVALGDDASWRFAPGAPIAQRSAPPSPVQLETCGRCHVRGAQIWPDDAPGTPLAQTHRVSLLDAGLYHADGQIDGEVYEYGSFLESRMHAAGVQCSDCHDPHSAKLRAPGNVLCATCHAPQTFDVPAHHHHAPGTPGAQCVSCHMPEKLYMVVDGRRDHSLQVPRPDLSAKIGTPNACTGCHRDKPAAWAAEQVAAWRGPQKPPPWHWGEAIHAGRTNAAGALDLLLRAAGERSVPAIARATAVSLLAGQRSARVGPALVAASKDADPLVRRAAAEAAAHALPPAERVALAAPLLADPMRSVRFEALGSLLDVPPAQRTSVAAAELDRVVAEYRASQAYNADRAESWFNLGQLDARLGDAAAAQKALETAIRRAPAWAAPYVQLADLQRRTGDEAAAEATLRRAVAAAPRSPDAHAALGMALVRQKKHADALPAFRRAAELAPEEPRHAWVYAIALHDGGDPKTALDVLRRAQQRHPNAPDLLSTLAQYSAEAGDRAAALAWARKLADVTGDPDARRMVEMLERAP